MVFVVNPDASAAPSEALLTRMAVTKPLLRALNCLLYPVCALKHSNRAILAVRQIRGYVRRSPQLAYH